jgi:hypothetical protein
MKKTLLFISVIIISISSFAQYEGFENWTQNSIQILDDYETSASGRGLEGALATYPVPDPVTGSLSIKLETVLGSNGDTIFGYFLSGDPDTQAPGQAVSIGAVDSIVGWYKCDIQSGDSAGIICMTSFLSTPSGGGMYYFSGAQPSWKRFAYYVGAPAADSMLFAAATGDPMNNFDGIPGSWIQFDDIQLKGPAGTMNVLNFSFENWTPISWEEPNGWATGNLWAIGQPTMPVIKTTDSYAGTYALDLSVVLSTGGDTLWGAASNGYWGENGAAGGQPFTGSPTAVECWYKYAPVGGDNAMFSVEFKSGGGGIGNYGNNFNTPASTYTHWTQAIPPLTPDTVLIAIWAGNNIGSQFIVDNIDFVFPVGIAEGLTVEKLVAYPNPATDILKIKFNIEKDNNVNIRLVDALGKELTTRSLGHLSSGTYRESFNTSDFSTGVYFLEFTLGDEKLVKRFAIK